MSSPIYLDYNATAPVRPEVVEAVTAALAEVGNPSSIHAFGRAARERVEEAREHVARLAGCRPDQVVFTGSGTEANHLALRGSRRARVLRSAIEHNSVMAAAAQATEIPVKTSGVIDLSALERLLAEDSAPTLVSVMMANNETGAVQPVAEVAALARAHDALAHCDAIQAAGKMPVDLAELGVDLLSLSAHKLGGPQGVGALIVGDRADLAPLQSGGGQERGRRAGTEGVPAIVGFGVAAQLAVRDLDHFARLSGVRDDLEFRLAAAAPETVVVAGDTRRLANTSCLAMPGVDAETLVVALDLAGIAVSAGAACSSGKVRTSHVLTAMGLGPDVAGSAVRVSLGLENRADDVDRFVAEWQRLCGRLAAA